MSRPFELDLGDVRADRGGEWIAADDDNAAERGLPEQQRREQAGRLVDAQVLDVVDDEHASLRVERLRERPGHAAQGAFGTRAERAGAIAGMAVDDRARNPERGRELGEQPRLSRAECAVQ